MRLAVQPVYPRRQILKFSERLCFKKTKVKKWLRKIFLSSTCMGDPAYIHTDTTPFPHRCTEIIDTLLVRARKTRDKFWHS